MGTLKGYSIILDFIPNCTWLRIPILIWLLKGNCVVEIELIAVILITREERDWS